MDDFSPVRRHYAELIRQRANLRSERLACALSEVPREDYLGPGPWKIMRFVFPLKYEDTPDANPARVYDDVLVALDADRNLNNGLRVRSRDGSTAWTFNPESTLCTLDAEPDITPR